MEKMKKSSSVLDEIYVLFVWEGVGNSEISYIHRISNPVISYSLRIPLSKG